MPTALTPDRDEEVPLRLEERVLEALREHAGAFAFNGLRRTLGAHPESLSRALRRLERWGQIAHDATGYRLTDPETTSDPDLPSVPPAPRADAPARQVLAEVQLGPGIDGTQLLGSLAGRWTGPLRWVGVYDRVREPLLAWSRADGPGQLLLGLRDGRLRVYAESEHEGPVPKAISDAGQDLLIFALGRLRSTVANIDRVGAHAYVLGGRSRSFGPN